MDLGNCKNERGELPSGQVWEFLGRKDRGEEAKSQHVIVR